MTGLPVAAGSTAFTTFAPSQVVMFDMEPSVPGYDVMYVTNSSTTTTLAGIYKYCKNAAGEWVSFGTYGSIATDGSYYGITGKIIDGLPVLYVTRGITNNTTVSTNQLIQLLEAGGYSEAMNAALAAVTDATASGKSGTIRGVAFFPTPSYYYKGAGNLNELSNWGTSLNGTGTAPLNFTAPDQTFFITNGTNATFSGDFSVTGPNSKIIVGDGTNATTLTVPAAFSINGEVDVYSNAVLSIQNEQLPSLHYLAKNSTINYAGAVLQNVIPMAYSNLTNNNNVSARIDGIVSVANNFIQNGLLQGQGTLNVPNGLTNNGAISPGNGPGLLSVTGNFTNAVSGTIAIELAGNTAAGIDYDQLVVNGAISLNGTLSISTTNGFNPQPGQVFTIITGSAITGTFSAVNWPAGFTGTVIYNPTSVQISIDLVVLPLKLFDFRASLKQNGSVQLEWETASEDNTSHFEIEKSLPPQSVFTSLLNQPAVGSGNNHYSVIDLAPAKGINLYRLKMVDKNGGFTYSNTVKMIVGNAVQKFVVYPNPVSKTLTLTHAAAVQGAILQILSADGKVVLAKKLTSGEIQTILEVSSIKPAWYMITLINGTNKESAGFLKQ